MSSYSAYIIKQGKIKSATLHYAALSQVKSYNEIMINMIINHNNNNDDDDDDDDMIIIRLSLV